MARGGGGGSTCASCPPPSPEVGGLVEPPVPLQAPSSPCDHGVVTCSGRRCSRWVCVPLSQSRGRVCLANDEELLFAIFSTLKTTLPSGVEVVDTRDWERVCPSFADCKVGCQWGASASQDGGGGAGPVCPLTPQRELLQRPIQPSIRPLAPSTVHLVLQRMRTVDRPLKLALERVAVRRDATSRMTRDSMFTFEDLLAAKA
jgi:hypothetical protein